MKSRTLFNLGIAGLTAWLLYLGTRKEYAPKSSVSSNNGEWILETPPRKIEEKSDLQQPYQRKKLEIKISEKDKERFTNEVLPVARDLVSKLESLESKGLILPFKPYLTPDNLTHLNFEQEYNMICKFVLDNHFTFRYHDIKTAGKEGRDIHAIGNIGEDERGMPYNLGDLLGEGQRYMSFIKELADKNVYPPFDVDKGKMLSQEIIRLLHPSDYKEYVLRESGRPEAGANILPFYTFTYLRNDEPANSSNVLNDGITTILKSTKDGIELYQYEDSTINFLPKRKDSK